MRIALTCRSGRCRARPALMQPHQRARKMRRIRFTMALLLPRSSPPGRPVRGGSTCQRRPTVSSDEDLIFKLRLNSLMNQLTNATTCASDTNRWGPSYPLKTLSGSCWQQRRLRLRRSSAPTARSWSAAINWYEMSRQSMICYICKWQYM